VSAKACAVDGTVDRFVVADHFAFTNKRQLMYKRNNAVTVPIQHGTAIGAILEQMVLGMSVAILGRALLRNNRAWRHNPQISM
jgi:hypothetical protein